MQTIFSLLLRLILLAAGLLFAASLLLAAALFMSVWGLRAMWARLTGRPAAPLVMRVDPRSGFQWMVRRGHVMSAAQAEDSRSQERRGQLVDIVDVEPKPPRN